MDNITQKDAEEILSESREYFYSGATRDIAFRLEQLKKLKRAIIDNEALILEALYKDLRKSEFEAYTTEIGYLLDSISFMSRNLRSWVKVRKVKTPIVHTGAKSYVYPEPYGTVLVVGPFNYPFQLVIEPLIGAISAGNCAVIKPSEYTPNVSGVISKIIGETFDKKYIRVVEGGKETTSLLINLQFDYMFFTGSVPVGKIVMEAAAKNLVPVTLELGGKSPCIVDRNANLEVAARRIAWGKFMNLGQTCVAPDYLLVQREVKDKFIGYLLNAIKEFYGENPAESSDYGRIVNERHASRIVGLINKDKVIFGGLYDIKNLYVSPTVMDNVTWKDEVMKDEIFGPVLPILEYDGINDAIKTINSHPKPLALYVFTENRAVSEKVLGNTSFGGGCVNDTVTHLATPFLPFGGVGTSGIGSYHGESSFKTFSHLKSVLKKSTRLELKFLYPPYNEKKIALIRRFLK